MVWMFGPPPVSARIGGGVKTRSATELYIICQSWGLN